MKSLFKIAAKKILTENLPIALHKDSLPKAALSDYRIYTTILRFNRNSTTRVPPLPAIPEECFVFDREFLIHIPRTLARAEKVMDPVGIFKYYVALGNLEGIASLWTQLDDEQKDRAYDSCDQVTRFLFDFLDTGTVPPESQLLQLYRSSKSANFYISFFIFRLFPVRLRSLTVLCELYNALNCQEKHRAANCRHLAGLVAYKDFEIKFNELDESVATDLEATIRSNHSNFLRLPKNCRIPEVEDFAREKIGPYVPCDVPDSGYPPFIW
uniref:SWIM-type domain-containing protein n=1 Tax=Steinernema glaseri TaxID=37863 RepID=A0A1I8AGW1_9BILA